MDWEDVVEVRTEAPLTLYVRFKDGVTGKVRFELTHLTGVFEKLKDADLFARASVENGAVTWPGELDLAPDAMYDAIKANGEWILR